MFVSSAWQSPEPGLLRVMSRGWYKPGIHISVSFFFLGCYPSVCLSSLCFSLLLSDFAIFPPFFFRHWSGQQQLRTHANSSEMKSGNRCYLSTALELVPLYPAPLLSHPSSSPPHFFLSLSDLSLISLHLLLLPDWGLRQSAGLRLRDWQMWSLWRARVLLPKSVRKLPKYHGSPRLPQDPWRPPWGNIH